MAPAKLIYEWEWVETQLSTAQGESSSCGQSSSRPQACSQSVRKNLMQDNGFKNYMFNGCWVRASFLTSARMNVFKENVYNVKLEKYLSEELNCQPKRGNGF